MIRCEISVVRICPCVLQESSPLSKELLRSHTPASQDGGSRVYDKTDSKPNVSEGKGKSSWRAAKEDFNRSLSMYLSAIRS